MNRRRALAVAVGSNAVQDVGLLVLLVTVGVLVSAAGGMATSLGSWWNKDLARRREEFHPKSRAYPSRPASDAQAEAQAWSDERSRYQERRSEL